LAGGDGGSELLQNYQREELNQELFLTSEGGERVVQREKKKSGVTSENSRGSKWGGRKAGLGGD